MSEIGWLERLKVLTNVTVNLSVSGPFSVVGKRAFPLSRARLLTIEWE